MTASRSPIHPGEHADPACRALLITCEYAGNSVPTRFRALFADDPGILDSHRGFDAGALTMARALARGFGAPLLAGKISRLIVDLNRSTGHARLHSDIVRRLPATARRRILERHYLPYRTQVEQLVVDTIAAHGRAIHVSSHSFTPELDGKVRHADIGLLYDPSRSREASLCARWKLALATCAPTLSVRRNYPYAGWNDGLTTWLRGRLPAAAYLGIELEINQKHVTATASEWRSLRRAVVTSLGAAIIGSLDGAMATPQSNTGSLS